MGISITNTIYLGKATPSSAGGSHNLGWYATPEALQTAHPTGNDGDWAMVGSTDTVWTWDSDTSAWVDTGTTNAADRNLSNLSSTGKANVSAQGTYDSGATYNAGTVGKAIQGKANVDMDNLTSVGANMSNWSTNASNCIAEIPQDINLTLSSGTLTLKAGSKVYVPNGFESDGTTPKFDVVTIDANKTVNMFGQTGQTMVFVRADISAWGNVLLSNCLSGTTVPSNHTGMFYKTDENKIYYYSGGVKQDTTFSLPLAITTASSGTVTSIDQVFNGFGFIGNTVYALPGVKVAQPDGRNADGTLKNNIRTIGAVKTGNNYAGTWFYSVGTQYISVAYYTKYFEQETMPSVNCNWYQPSTNNMYHVHNGVASLSHEVKIFDATRVSGAYTSLTPYLPFRAVDYNDTEFITRQAMPSTKYTVLSLGASGNSYTAPADGYYEISLGTDTDRYVQIINNSNNIGTSCVGGTIVSSKAFMVVSKDDSVTVYYSGTGAGVSFRFVYANGSK